MWYCPSKYGRHPVPWRPPDVVVRMLLKKQANEDALVDPECQRVGGANQVRVHDYTQRKGGQLERVRPSSGEGKDVLSEAMVDCVNPLVKEGYLVIGKVVPVEQEISHHQRNGKVADKFVERRSSGG